MSVSGLRTGVHLGLSALAQEFGVARETVRNRLNAAGVEPSGDKGGHPCYRLRDVVAAWTKSGDEVDPESLRPFERKAHWQAEHEKLRLEVERGELVPAIEVEQGEAEIFKLMTQALDTLPDILERDVGLSPLQLARVEKHVDELREALYQRSVADDEGDADRAVQDRAQR